MSIQNNKRNHKTICIVDDEPSIVEMYSFKLKLAGYRVISARDGKEGYQVISHKKPDLAIVDLIMPNMGGLSLVRKLKADKELRVIPIIILTNLDSPEEKREASMLGVFGKV
ncbi:response regulator [Candidatus Omnitrophota bacterium]